MIGKIELDWELLKKIAEYYQFPVTVFLLSKDYEFGEETRDNYLIKRLKKIEKLKQEIIEMIGDL